MKASKLSDERIFLPFSTDDIIFDGDTEREKDLHKKLFQIILELNSYQDRYDNGKMKDVDQVKSQIIQGSILSLTATTSREYESGFVDALRWVTDNCLTEDEKLALLPKVSNEEMEKLLERMKETSKRMQGAE